MESHSLRFFLLMECSALILLALLDYGYPEAIGAFSRHMLVHTALMTVAAPVLALLIVRLFPSKNNGGTALLLPAALQQGLVFSLWHSPPGMRLAMGSPESGLFMHTILLSSALWFWHAVFTQKNGRKWPAVAALLLTGKYFCLAGIILTFAPRVLYGTGAGLIAAALADQQLAGLLMITVCPLTYVSAAIIFISHWFRSLSARRGVELLRIEPERVTWPGR